MSLQSYCCNSPPWRILSVWSVPTRMMAAPTLGRTRLFLRVEVESYTDVWTSLTRIPDVPQKKKTSHSSSLNGVLLVAPRLVGRIGESTGLGVTPEWNPALVFTSCVTWASSLTSLSLQDPDRQGEQCPLHQVVVRAWLDRGYVCNCFPGTKVGAE